MTEHCKIFLSVLGAGNVLILIWTLISFIYYKLEYSKHYNKNFFRYATDTEGPRFILIVLYIIDIVIIVSLLLYEIGMIIYNTL